MNWDNFQGTITESTGKFREMQKKIADTFAQTEI